MDADIPGRRSTAAVGAPVRAPLTAGSAGICRDPVLIIGTERSGSNVLRLVLNAHPDIAVPHPPHFMRYFGPLADVYGDLAVPANKRRLARDAYALLRRHIHPWEHPIDVERVVQDASPTLFGVVAEFYEQYRRAEGKRRWGCKSTFMVDAVDEVLAERPGARFIWLVRDPRDVAVSATRAVFGPSHPYSMACLWAEQQRRAADAADRLGDEQVLLVRYEDLVARPEKEIIRVCAFLGERPVPEMLAPHRSASARRIAALSESWRNTGRPITTSSVGRYQDALSAGDLRAVECAAAALMPRLGYTPVTGGEDRRPSALGVRWRGTLLRTRIELRSLRHDRNHLLRWRRDLLVRRLRLKAAARRIAPRRTEAL
ncbi:sulfotransferase family protein [Streptomyces sp. NPDC059629]|uniref:sulfotransferase family protein n=1 Tax=Streptomyces sp. NPDC059629 TaxID=3346889 RepID=UPI0036D00483